MAITKSHTRMFVCRVAAACVLGIVGVTSASAQVNCNVLPHGAQRANCYGQMSQIYRQQSQQYYGIARQQYQTHVNVGRALARVPVVGRYAAPAWNAPRAYYNLRYGRPR